MQAPTHSTAPTVGAVPVRRRGARASISALPTAIVPTAAQRITKKANKADVRKTALPPPPQFSAPSSSAAGGAPPRAMFLGGVQRPAAHGKSASVSIPLRAPASQQGRSAPLAAASRASLVAGGAGAGAGTGPRPSGLRLPTSRVGSSGIVAPRVSTVGGATRLSVAGVGSRVGSSSGVMKPVAGKSDGVRMMRRA